MRAIIWNFFKLEYIITFDGRLLLKNLQYDSRGEQVEVGTFAITAAAAIRFVTAAITGTITGPAVFCFQNNNIHGQDGTHITTNCCRRRFTRQRCEELKAGEAFCLRIAFGTIP